MGKAILQTIRSCVTPWELYRRLASVSPKAFFLDSIRLKSPDQNYSYLGAAPFLELSLQNGKIKIAGEYQGVYPEKNLFEILRALFKKYKNLALPGHGFFTGGAVGFWGYETARLFDRMHFRPKPAPGTPDLYLAFHRDLLVYDHRASEYRWISKDKKPDLRPFEKNAGRFQEDRFLLKKFRAEIPKARFMAMVRKAKEYIRRGDIYQANLSQRFSFEFQGSALRLYDSLRRINPSPFASFIQIGDLKIISSSPERLIRKTGRFCETRPIAGTRSTQKTGMSPKAIEKELLVNEKERAEHIMLVDLERNDLGRVCDFQSVKVEDFLKIEKYSHVMHLVSKVTGRLQKDKDALDLLRAMFPGGTITGCPKIRCMEIIDELEPVRRGLYTGSIGYLDFAGDMDLNIVIRTLILKGSKGYLQVGAGIVHDSDPEREYEETLQKGEALMQALVQAGV